MTWHRGRGLLAALVLAAFGLHALIPEGFMPGGGRLSIQICPDGFPTQLLNEGARHHHGSNPTHADRCAFGCAGSSGPITSVAHLGVTALSRDAPAVDIPSVAVAVCLVHLPQPRAPPGSADLTSTG
jgi:hypothetical protein